MLSYVYYLTGLDWDLKKKQFLNFGVPDINFTCTQTHKPSWKMLCMPDGRSSPAPYSPERKLNRVMS